LTLRLTNIIFSIAAVIFQSILIIPWTIATFKSDGGAEGWGYLFLPLTFSLHFLLLSSLTVLLTFKNEVLARRIYILTTFLAAIGTMLSFVYGVAIITFLSLTLILLATFTWTRKLRFDLSTLILNLILLSSMTYWATQFH
jgi:hypothetical protein